MVSAQVKSIIDFVKQRKAFNMHDNKIHIQMEWEASTCFITCNRNDLIRNNYDSFSWEKNALYYLSISNSMKLIFRYSD